MLHSRFARSFSASRGASSVDALGETMSLLRNLRNGSEIFLVGTAHISKTSAEEVRSVIRSVNPDNVFVELCDDRAAAIRRGISGGDQNGGGDGVPDTLRRLLSSFGCVHEKRNSAPKTSTLNKRNSLRSSV